MKKIISLLLVLILCFSGINTVDAKEKTDKEVAIGLIDGLINELKAIGHDNFNSYDTDDFRTKASNWMGKYNDVLDCIRLNGRKASDSVYNLSATNFNYETFSKTYEYYDYIGHRDENNEWYQQYEKVTKTIDYRNYYNYYLTHLVFLKQIINNTEVKQYEQLVKECNVLNSETGKYNSLMWRRNAAWTFALLPEEIKKYSYYNSLNFSNFNAASYVINENQWFVEHVGYPKIETPKITTTIVGNTSTITNIVNQSNVTNSKSRVNLGIKNLKAKVKKNKVTVSFNEVDFAIKYQIQISLKKNFKKAKAYNVIDSIKTIKKLKRKKTYYIRVRAVGYDTLGKWSVKKIKTK